MEHTLSRETMERIQDRLDDPITCPHGNPLPGHEALLKEWIPLGQTKAGQQVTITRVHESAEQNHALMVFLEEQNLMPGTEATVREIIPLNQTISLQVGQEVVVLGLSVAEHIFVEICE
jgi:DtxR family Mn-dependent transcriptional regulator